MEGFGFVIAELLAAGTPALVTAIGGLSEVVTGVSPVLAIRVAGAATMKFHLAGAARRHQLPDMDACQIHAADTFSLTTAAARVTAVYRGALSKR